MAFLHQATRTRGNGITQNFGLNSRETLPDLTKHHGIKVLSDFLLAYLKVLDLQIDPRIRRLLLELNEVDEDGQRFRYTRTKQGEGALPDMSVDLENLRAGFHEIGSYLGGLDAYLDQLLEFRSEWAS